MEHDGGSVLVVAACANHLDLGGGLAEGVLLHVDLALAAHLGAQVVAQRVHTAHAHAVQAARHFVRPLVEFAAGMKHGHDHFECALVQFFMLVDGDAASVVAHGDGVVLADGDVYRVAIAGQRFVDRIVHDLAHQVVQTLDVCVADIHGWTFAYGLKSFENLNVMRGILLIFLLFYVEIFSHNLFKKVQNWGSRPKTYKITKKWANTKIMEL